MYNRAYGSNFSGGIWNGIKNSFKQGTTLTRLIYINIGVFLVIKILEVFFVLAGQRGFEQLLLPYVGVPALPERLLYTPWTIITYMFTQFGFLHLLFNMLWLYWFGSIFQNTFSSQKLTGVYLLGGITGAIIYMAAYALFPAFELERYQSVGHRCLGIRHGHRVRRVYLSPELQDIRVSDRPGETYSPSDLHGSHRPSKYP